MSDIIVTIVIMLAVFLPMGYMMMKRKNGKSAEIKEMIASDGLTPGLVTELNNLTLAMDRNYTYAYKLESQHHTVEKIQLSDVASCEVIKGYEHGVAHAMDVQLLTAVSIVFKMKDKSQHSWVVFDNKKDEQIGSDLLDAQDFVYKLKNHIS